MQLQNAADAVAFGTSTLEARFMNYCAYTNRAMVANEVAVGQLVGILSLTDQLVSQGEYLHFYGELIQPIGEALESIPCPIPIPEIIGGIINAIAELMQTFGDAVSKVSSVIEKGIWFVEQGAVPVLSSLNWGYGASQDLVRMATMAASSYNIFQTIADNSPGTTLADPIDVLVHGPSAKGVQISPIGLIALGGHMVEFSSIIDMIPKYNFEELQKTHLPKLLDKFLKKYFDIDIDTKKIKDLFKIEIGLLDKIGELEKYQYTPYIRRFWVLPEKEKEKKKDEGESQDVEMDEFDQAGNKIASTGVEENKDKDKDKDKDGPWKDLFDFSKNKELRETGMSRFAGTVREGRDPFTSGSKDPVTIHTKWGDIDYTGRGSNLTFGVKSNDNMFGNYFTLESKAGLVSSGGSELFKKNGSYAWTAMDVTNMKSVTNLQLEGDLKKGADFIKKITKKYLGCTIDFQGKIDEVFHLIELLQLPAGNGFCQAAFDRVELSAVVKEKDVQLMALWVLLNGFMHMDKPTPAPDGYYGHALSPLNWSAFIPDIPGIDLGELEIPGIFHRIKEPENKPVNYYLGLPMYNDLPTKYRPSEDPENPPVLGYKMPFFIIGLIRGMEDTTSDGPQFGGRFDLLHNEQDQITPKQISTVAKSQVYFSRPDDLSYFKRSDGNKEKPNLFSPFWQARLVKSTNLDRLIFLALQDNVLWLPTF